MAAACASDPGPSSSGSSVTTEVTTPVTIAITTPITTEVSPPPSTPQGFDSTLVRLTEPDGTTCERCLWLAALGEDRRRGLMGVTSMGDRDGMVFVYEPAKLTEFWMKDTVLPLSIRFYTADGVSAGAFDMDPCAVEPCPTYGPDLAFRWAVEVEQGQLEQLGFTDSAVLEVLGLPCDSPTA